MQYVGTHVPFVLCGLPVQPYACKIYIILHVDFERQPSLQLAERTNATLSIVGFRSWVPPAWTLRVHNSLRWAQTVVVLPPSTTTSICYTSNAAAVVFTPPSALHEPLHCPWHLSRSIGFTVTQGRHSRSRAVSATFRNLGAPKRSSRGQNMSGERGRCCIP